MNPVPSAQDEVVSEHFLATLYGIAALLLGTAVWSAMPPLFGPWALFAAPGLGWLIAWAHRHGARVTDTFVRALAWIMALAGALLSLFVSFAFLVTQTSPDAGFQAHDVGGEYLRLFTEPPWFGSLTVLLVLGGAWRALRDPPSRQRSAGPAAVAPPLPGASVGPLAERAAAPSARLAEPERRAPGPVMRGPTAAAPPPGDGTPPSARAAALPGPGAGPASPCGPGSRAA